MPQRNWVAALAVDSSQSRGIDDDLPAEETAARARTRARQSGLDPAVAARRTDPHPAGAVPAARLHLSEIQMLVQFRSPATETITLFGDAAIELLKLMGATGRVPGGLSAEDVPPALQRLESAVEGLKASTNADTAARPADNEDTATDEDT